MQVICEMPCHGSTLLLSSISNVKGEDYLKESSFCLCFGIYKRVIKRFRVNKVFNCIQDCKKEHSSFHILTLRFSPSNILGNTINFVHVRYSIHHKIVKGACTIWQSLSQALYLKIVVTGIPNSRSSKRGVGKGEFS